jgi:hypothetical protein
MLQTYDQQMATLLAAFDKVEALLKAQMKAEEAKKRPAHKVQYAWSARIVMGIR